MLGKIFPGDMRWGHYYPDFHFHTRVIRRAATTVGTGDASKISSKTNTSSVGSSVSLRRQSSLNSEREEALYKRLSTLSEPDLDFSTHQRGKGSYLPHWPLRPASVQVHGFASAINMTNFIDWIFTCTGWRLSHRSKRGLIAWKEQGKNYLR